MSEPLRIEALGAGVQSTTVALMSRDGELPRLDACIFADTGWEPRAVYAHLDWLQGELERAGIPVYRVSAGNIRDRALASAAGERTDYPGLPFHLSGLDGKPGMLRRQCTSRFKIQPIRQKIGELIGSDKKPGAVEQWFGISLDEIQRMRDSDVAYIVHRYPLVDARMTRHDCLRWLETHGYPQPPKSACIGCPYHNAAAWQDMKRNRPDEWVDAVAFDRAIRHLPRIEGDVYLHRSLTPLGEIDLRTREERGELNLFDAECEGVCGV